MYNTPRGNRLHIAIFGRRNVGKSSLINAITNQDIALVSSVPGTTTDPVYKTMEMLPVGPVVFIDTAGIDDIGELGEQRVKRSYAVLNKADIALLVVESGAGISSFERKILEYCQEKNLPLVGVLNKIDLQETTSKERDKFKEKLHIDPIEVSALTRKGITDLKVAIIRAAPPGWDEQPIIGDLLQPGDIAILVVPIDLAAPKGRLILPQVQTLRDVLDNDAISLVVKERELREAITSLNRRPKIVVTDSQVFLKADADTPRDILLTSFSILFARYKGALETLVAGAMAIEELEPGDKILMVEACTHHRVEDDIGRVKIPRWLRQKVGGQLHFDWVSGYGFPSDLGDYKLIIHCGACMINRREMLARITQTQAANVPIVNYGVCIAHVMGILPRALSPFPAVQQLVG